MIIKSSQIEAFKTEALHQFFDDMVQHVKKYFVNHYNNLGEETLRLTVEYGYFQAKRYDITTVRNVCLYINNMILLGSNYDIDPAYPWAGTVLTEKTSKNPSDRMDELSRKVREFIRKVFGPGNLHIFRALSAFAANSDGIYQDALTYRLDNVLSLLKHIYPSKAELIGDEALANMVKLGTRNAKRYGLQSEASIAVYAMLMFLMGSGFDNDPQFPWAAQILNNAATGEEARIKALYSEASNRLITALNNYQQ